MLRQNRSSLGAPAGSTEAARPRFSLGGRRRSGGRGTTALGAALAVAQPPPPVGSTSPASPPPVLDAASGLSTAAGDVARAGRGSASTKGQPLAKEVSKREDPFFGFSDPPSSFRGVSVLDTSGGLTQAQNSGDESRGLGSDEPPGGLGSLRGGAPALLFSSLFASEATAATSSERTAVEQQPLTTTSTQQQLLPSNQEVVVRDVVLSMNMWDLMTIQKYCSAGSSHWSTLSFSSHTGRTSIPFLQQRTHTPQHFSGPPHSTPHPSLSQNLRPFSGILLVHRASEPAPTSETAQPLLPAPGRVFWGVLHAPSPVQVGGSTLTGRKCECPVTARGGVQIWR